jgi:hypothetical protein
MSSEDIRQVEQDVLRFWRDLDQRDYPAMLTALAPDCRWLREEWIEGAIAIEESLMKRPADLLTRHLVTNIITDEDDRGVTVSHLVTTFAGKGSIETGPLPSAVPALVANIEMTIVRRDGRWLISRIEPTIVFR